MKNTRKNYARWQDDNVTESGAQRVAGYPEQPGHHLEWSVDVQGNAMARSWIVLSIVVLLLLVRIFILLVGQVCCWTEPRGPAMTQWSHLSRHCHRNPFSGCGEQER
jgi:hypothetical protein